MLGRREQCHCGSGKRYKSCCYPNDSTEKARGRAGTANNASQGISRLGVPGEEAFVLITYVIKDGTETPKEGAHGEYDVVFYFRKPGAVFDEKNISLDIDQHTGSSLLAIANPALNFNDPRFDGQDTKMKLYVATTENLKAEAFGTPNKDGFLSDIRVTLTADSIVDAGKRAKVLLIPAISALSFASDIPLHISHTVVREKATGVTQRDLVVPFLPAAARLQPYGLQADARVLFNRYRDGLNSEDPNWRFLCFASILEQLWKKTEADKSVDLRNIVIPKTDRDLIAWFKAAFPEPFNALEDRICLDDVPMEARGMTTNDVIMKYVKPLRHSIAHSLLEDGALPSDQDDVKHRAEVRKWATLLRCITRIHLQAVYRLPTI